MSPALERRGGWCFYDPSYRIQLARFCPSSIEVDPGKGFVSASSLLQHSIVYRTFPLGGRTDEFQDSERRGAPSYPCPFPNYPRGGFVRFLEWAFLRFLVLFPVPRYQIGPPHVRKISGMELMGGGGAPCFIQALE